MSHPKSGYPFLIGKDGLVRRNFSTIFFRPIYLYSFANYNKKGFVLGTFSSNLLKYIQIWEESINQLPAKKNSNLHRKQFHYMLPN